MSTMEEQSREATRFTNEKEFMNANTNHEKWLVFQRVMNWAMTASELAAGRLKDNAILRENNDELGRHVQRLSTELHELRNQRLKDAK